MSIPYTYLLIHIPTKQAYYGVRYSKNCDPSDLWQTYFSSSKLVKDLIIQYGKESFYFEVRRTFKCKEDATRWEFKVLKRLKIFDKDNWLNKTIAPGPPPGDIRGNKNPMKDIKQRERMRKDNPSFRSDVRAKISEKNKGRIGTFKGKNHSKETKQKMKEVWQERKASGWKHPGIRQEIKEYLSKKFKGRIVSEETRNKIRLAVNKHKKVGSDNPASKKLRLHGIEYKSIRDACIKTGLSIYMVKKECEFI